MSRFYSIQLTKTFWLSFTKYVVCIDSFFLLRRQIKSHKLMSVLCSEVFSCRVGNNHQIHWCSLREEKKSLLSTNLSSFSLLLRFVLVGLAGAGYWCHQWTRWRLLGVRPSSPYILNSCNAINWTELPLHTILVAVLHSGLIIVK